MELGAIRGLKVEWSVGVRTIRRDVILKTALSKQQIPEKIPEQHRNRAVYLKIVCIELFDQVPF